MVGAIIFFCSICAPHTQKNEKTNKFVQVFLFQKLSFKSFLDDFSQVVDDVDVDVDVGVDVDADADVVKENSSVTLTVGLYFFFTLNFSLHFRCRKLAKAFHTE